MIVLNLLQKNLENLSDLGANTRCISAKIGLPVAIALSLMEIESGFGPLARDRMEKWG